MASMQERPTGSMATLLAAIKALTTTSDVRMTVDTLGQLSFHVLVGDGEAQHAAVVVSPASRAPEDRSVTVACANILTTAIEMASISHMLEETQAVLHETLERLDHAVSARDNYHIRLKDAHQQVLDLSAAHNRLSSLYHKRSEELDATAEEVVRLRHAVVHGLGAIAACPSCGAERTNGEQHDDDCPLLPYLREQEDRRAAAST